MVAYSFHERFCDDIAAGRKCQTIRGHRKRHARPGEPVQLYYAMRTKHCRKLREPDPFCISVTPVDIYTSPDPVIGCSYSLDGREPQTINHGFALADGFSSVRDFWEFWVKMHGPGLFNGVLIKWEQPWKTSSAQ